MDNRRVKLVSLALVGLAACSSRTAAPAACDEPRDCQVLEHLNATPTDESRIDAHCAAFTQGPT